MADEVRRALAEGRLSVPPAGAVVTDWAAGLSFRVVDDDGHEIPAVSAYLRDLMGGEVSPLTCRSYAFGLLRWYRLLWCLAVGWDRASATEVATLVEWMRAARNPRARPRHLAPAPSSAASAERETVMASPGKGYAGKTIDHALTVVHGFYAFHGRQGSGPQTNPVLAYRRALEPATPAAPPRSRRKAASRAPRVIPAARWNEMIAAMGCDRDRALLEFYVSTGARVSELLRLTLEDIDWADRLIYVVAMRSRLRRPIRASADAFRHLERYLAGDGPPDLGQPLWRTRRGQTRPMTYWAAQQVLQRADDQLGTEWTWHDARHTVISRMTHDEHLAPVQLRAPTATGSPVDRHHRVRHP
ncbi:tyrosine-type recombinase/integrase [Sphaerisporangium dianthi]|uniref:Tyrosine-type recombinase/integrase n=1 Tax=Sphaerisporangium dianthi TaxID=1436120 RepID=A0ABV9CVG2_9ACTN